MIDHIRNIRTSGTIVPSSGFLVERLLAGVDFATARSVVELGAGNGCVTREILRRLRHDARLVSVEINPVFVERCRAFSDPRFTIVPGCAAELPGILREQGLEEVDAVVSSLPLGVMDEEVVSRVLDGVRESLGPHGTFVQYQYSLAHHDHLTPRYADVSVAFVPANVPPAFVYTCTQRRPSPATARRRIPSLASAYAATLAAVTVAVRALQQL